MKWRERWERSGATASMFAVDAFRLGCEETSADYREALTALKQGINVVPFLLSVIASGEALSAREVAEIRSHYREALAALDALVGEEATDG